MYHDIWPNGKGVEFDDFVDKAEIMSLTNDIEKMVEQSLYHQMSFILFPSCRSAIYHIIKSEGLGRTDSLSISRWSSHCVISTISRLANPVIEDKVTSEMILLNHQYGRAKSKEGNVYRLVIEDSCDSLLENSGGLLCAGGKYEVFSLPKILGTGWGGAVITDSADSANKLRKIRNLADFDFAKSQFLFKNKYFSDTKNSTIWYGYWHNGDAENGFMHQNALGQIKEALVNIDQLYESRKKRINIFLKYGLISEKDFLIRMPPVVSFLYDESVYNKLLEYNIELPIRNVNISKYADNSLWKKCMLVPVHQQMDEGIIKRVCEVLANCKGNGIYEGN